MCVIIDKDTFAHIFRKNFKGHEHFEPVYIWISKGNGKIVYGGTKYLEELKQATRYHTIFNLFKTVRRAVEIDKNLVDEKEEELKSNVPKKDLDDRYNDTHIVSLVIVSKCKIVCTHDKGLSEFLKISAFYPEGVDIPLIYSNKSNKYMLNNDNIVDCCRPCEKLKQIKLSS